MKINAVRPKIAFVTLLASVFSLTLACAKAGSATWNLNPISGDWNTAANWTPTTVPNGPTAVATFGVSNITDVSISDFTTVDSIVFNPGAGTFTITPLSSAPQLNVTGAGIINNSGAPQNFVSPEKSAFEPIAFHNQATAGSQTFFTLVDGPSGAGEIDFYNFSNAGGGTFINLGQAAAGAFTQFFDHSSAAQGTFVNNSAAAGDSQGGHTIFFESSTAANATITNEGGVAPEGQGGGLTQFFQSSTAGDATIIDQGGTGEIAAGGLTEFSGGKPGNATLIALGGTDGGGGGSIGFGNATTGGTARVEIFGNGRLDIRSEAARMVEVGSIEGDGDVFLGANRLIVGSNNLSTLFSGVIQDDDANQLVGGSLSKVGSGSLTLSGVNTYTGGTTIEAGTLLAQTKRASATGTGAVQVNAGTLGGRGKMSGAVTIGSGTGAGAFLAPGVNGAAGLTTQSSLTFNADGTYNCEVDMNKNKSDKITAAGVTINHGALFSFIAIGNQTLAQGTVFTVINNTSRNPLTGTFANLADGATIIADGSTFQASYEGGDGNDLTLTVVQ